MTEKIEILNKIKNQNDFSLLQLDDYDWKFVGECFMTTWNNTNTKPKPTQFFVSGFGTADAKLLAVQATSFNGKDLKFRWQVSNLLHISGEMDYDSNLKGLFSKSDN